MYLKSITETSFSGSISTKSFQRGFPSIFAHKSQRALIMAAVAKWITPFSGPIHLIWLWQASVFQNWPKLLYMSSSFLPTTKGSKALTACTTLWEQCTYYFVICTQLFIFIPTSVPLPIVKVNPWPKRSVLSVLKIT